MNMSLYKKYFKCGSRVTCNPPVLDTDEDTMYLVDKDDLILLDKQLLQCGYVLGGSIVVDKESAKAFQEFWSYTKDDLNILITTSEKFYDKFLLATQVCTKLNLLNKEDRIILFQAILYNNYEYGICIKL